MFKLIAGLGNPGNKYDDTRHNVGFKVVDLLKTRWQTISCTSKFEAEICEVHFGEQKVFLLKSQTYMNESGQPIGEFARYYKINPEEVLVIYDDVDLPVANLRFSQGGSSGHQGVRSVIENLGADFGRLRIGIGDNRASGLKSEDYVLQQFKPEEKDLISKSITQSAEIVDLLIKNDKEKVQQKISEFNKSL